MELTIVISVMLLLASVMTIGTGPYIAYRDGRQAGEALRSVYAAQMTYLSDNPAVDLTSLGAADAAARITPYMPTGTWPPVLPKVNGATPQVLANRMPPVASLDGTTPYDPSGSTTDNLWDVGSY